MTKYIVTLTDEERGLLQKIISSGNGAARKLLHARILLQADADGLARTDEVTAQALQVAVSTIHRVRQRFVEQSFESALVPARPPPRPDKVKISGDVERQLIALACGDPPAGRCRWTLNLLANRIIELGYADNALSRETVRQAPQKKDIDLLQVKTWCIPPKANADFVWHMEDVLQTYQLPYDPRFPVVCMDEASKQLIGEVQRPLPVRAGKARCVDYEYERKGVCNLFVCCEPLRGWRHVTVTDRRTKRDWAACIRELVDVHYPRAERLRLVLDNLNTHTGASLYEAFPPAEARRLLDRLEFHHTPKHASWLNMAEIEIGIVSRQCLGGRIDDAAKMTGEIDAWESERNAAEAKIHWSFTIAVARHKMKNVYPSIAAATDAQTGRNQKP